MKISVAMAVYNGGKYLQQQIDSIINQTVLPDEIVISDDGSSDNSLEIARNASLNTSIPIKILRNNSTRGFSSNFNNSLSNVSGDLIFLCDQDDIWEPVKIECFLHEIQQEKELRNLFFLVMSDMSVIDEDENIIFSSILNTRLIEPLDFTYGCSMAVGRKLLDAALPIPSDLVQHDVWINLISNLTKSKKVIKRPLIQYRRHASNVTPKIAGEKETFLEMIRFAREFRYRMRINEEIMSTVLLRLKKILLGRLIEEEICRAALNRIENDIKASSVRTSGNSISRVIHFRKYIWIYKDAGLSWPQLLKDTILLNNVLQKSIK